MNLGLTAKLAVWRARVDYQGAMLGGLCAVVTAVLMLAYQHTSEPIKQRLAEDRQALLSQILPASYYDNQPFDDVLSIEDERLSAGPIEVFLAKRKGLVSAVVFQIETQGYGGTIQLIIALNTQGEILGLRTLSHKETPGLADKVEVSKSNWITKFNGESLQKTPISQWAVQKDGGKFDQFTGATITPRAIVKGVLEGLQFYARHTETLTAEKRQAQEISL